MQTNRHRPQDVIEKLDFASQLLSAGRTVGDVCRRLEISPATYYRWRREYGGLSPFQAEAIENLRRDNGTLRRTIDQLADELRVLRAVAAGNW